MSPNLTQARLKELLDYDPEMGQFTWLVNLRGSAKVGVIAGCNYGGGYRAITVDGVCYYAHRLAFFYMMGRWPVADIDHKNRERSDNRWTNLREASRSQNLANKEHRNKTGFKGVIFHSQSGLYRSAIYDRSLKKTKSLGYFKTPQEANAAFSVAALEMHGEFARV